MTNRGDPQKAASRLRCEQEEPMSHGASKQLALCMELPPVPQADGKTDPRKWLQWAAREWGEFHQRQMTVRWARDVALIRPLLRQHGTQELAARWSAYVQTPDEYLARRGWDVPSFSTSIDRYAGRADCVEAVRAWNLHRAPARHPLTGAVLRQPRRR